MAYCDTELTRYEMLQKQASTQVQQYEIPSALSDQVANNQEALKCHQSISSQQQSKQNRTVWRFSFKNKFLISIVIGLVALNILLIICLTATALQSSYPEKQVIVRSIEDLLKNNSMNTVHNLEEMLSNNVEDMLMNISVVNTDIMTRLLDTYIMSINSTSRLVIDLDKAINLIKNNTQNTLSFLASVVNTLSAVEKSSLATEAIVQNIENNLETLHNQHKILLVGAASSCQQIKDLHPDSTSGYYTVNGNKITYCKMGELCGSEGGWTRLAYLDMNDTTVNCPSTLSYRYSSGIRACARPTISTQSSCASVQFPSNSISYSEVCGRVVGYQYGQPDATSPSRGSIDSPYLEGISITRGNPRQHIWSLIAGYDETYTSCPCSSPPGNSPPSFVGNDYFCESGNPTSHGSPQLYPDDPLWNGEQCGGNEANCCSAAGLPWFHKTLSTDTTDFLELRNCGDNYGTEENVYINFYEIYIK